MWSQNAQFPSATDGRSRQTQTTTWSACLGRAPYKRAWSQFAVGSVQPIILPRGPHRKPPVICHDVMPPRPTDVMTPSKVGIAALTWLAFPGSAECSGFSYLDLQSFLEDSPPFFLYPLFSRAREREREGIRQILNFISNKSEGT